MVNGLLLSVIDCRIKINFVSHLMCRKCMSKHCGSLYIQGWLISYHSSKKSYIGRIGDSSFTDRFRNRLQSFFKKFFCLFFRFLFSILRGFNGFFDCFLIC